MSGDEVLVLLVSLAATLAFWGAWVHQHVVAAPMHGSRSRPGLAIGMPLVCAVVLFSILRTVASFDVRDSVPYTFLYMLLGAAWVGAAIRLSSALGISARDDVRERRNDAAALALGGAMLGITLAFAGGNIGDGPGWWVVVFSAALATVLLFVHWVVLDEASGIVDAITIDRDTASGFRLAGFLVAQGLILGRAVAGDWTSAAATVRDAAILGWPSLLLLAFAVLVERSFRPTPQRPKLPVPAYGIFPAAAYLVAAIAVVLRLEVA